MLTQVCQLGRAYFQDYPWAVRHDSSERNEHWAFNLASQAQERPDARQVHLQLQCLTCETHKATLARASTAGVIAKRTDKLPEIKRGEHLDNTVAWEWLPVECLSRGQPLSNLSKQHFAHIQLNCAKARCWERVLQSWRWALEPNIEAQHIVSAVKLLAEFLFSGYLFRFPRTKLDRRKAISCRDCLFDKLKQPISPSEAVNAPEFGSLLPALVNSKCEWT